MIFPQFLCTSNAECYFLFGCQAFYERPGQLTIADENLHFPVFSVKSLLHEESDVFPYTLSNLDSGIKDRPSHPLSRNFSLSSTFLPISRSCNFQAFSHPSLKIARPSAKNTAKNLGNTTTYLEIFQARSLL